MNIVTCFCVHDASFRCTAGGSGGARGDERESIYFMDVNNHNKDGERGGNCF